MWLHRDAPVVGDINLIDFVLDAFTIKQESFLISD